MTRSTAPPLASDSDLVLPVVALRLTGMRPYELQCLRHSRMPLIRAYWYKGRTYLSLPDTMRAAPMLNRGGQT
jgi:hypothetical protein